MIALFTSNQRLGCILTHDELTVGACVSILTNTHVHVSGVHTSLTPATVHARRRGAVELCSAVTSVACRTSAICVDQALATVAAW